MKIPVVTIMLAALAIAGCGRQQNNGTAAQAESAETEQTVRRPLEFDDLVYDFGRIDEAEGLVSHCYTFENTTECPIVIVRVQTRCNCLAAEFDRRPVVPSGKGTVTVTYNPAYRSGFFTEGLDIIYVADQREHHTRIWANGTVIPCKHPIEEDHPYDLGEGLHTNLKVLLAGNLRAGETKTIILNYANSLNVKADIRFEVTGATASALDMPSSAELQPDERCEMRISYTMPQGAEGVQRLTVQPFVNGVPTRPLEFTATAVLE